MSSQPETKQDISLPVREKRTNGEAERPANSSSSSNGSKETSKDADSKTDGKDDKPEPKVLEEEHIKPEENRGPHGRGARLLSEKVTKIVQEGTQDPRTQAPGLVVQIIDANGNTLNESVAGVRSLDSNEPMTADTTFWIASCTKAVTAIALMQLWESGKADLDSSDRLEEICPELKDVKIMEKGGGGGLREKKERITLRQLLTHTAGFSYSFFSDDIWSSHFGRDGSKDEFEGGFEAFKQPLIFEPGSGREYSIGIDWVGIFIERVSGQSLQEYFTENIFKPLRMNSTSFTLTEDTAKRMVTMHQRSTDFKSLSVNKKHAYYPARGVLPDDAPELFHSGGGGLISTADDYCKIIGMFLNDGLSPATGARILLQETVDLMFTNQLTEWDSKYKHQGFSVTREEMAQPFLRDGIPSAGPEGWGLDFQLYGDERFADKVAEKNVQFPRAAAPGICNVFWVLDRELGVGGIIMSQILPFADPHVLGLWAKIQEAMFEGAKKIGALGVKEEDE